MVLLDDVVSNIYMLVVVCSFFENDVTSLYDMMPLGETEIIFSKISMK